MKIGKNPSRNLKHQKCTMKEMTATISYTKLSNANK